MNTRFQYRQWVLAALITFAAAGCLAVEIPAAYANAPATSDSAAASIALPDFTPLVNKVGPAVVNITVTEKGSAPDVQQSFPQLPPNDPFFQFFKRFQQQQPQQEQEHPIMGLGSGFIISPDGYILTNAHVVDGAKNIQVKLTDKREFKGKVIGIDKRTDIALIKIDAHDLPTVSIGDPSKVKVGQWVVAIGSPFGFLNSVTAGIVSAKGRWLPNENYQAFIQTDVPINPGNSGGPLINMQGQVIGINSQIYTKSGGFMGLSFAIPIDIAMNVEQQLKTSGHVTRGRLGVEIQDVTADLAKSFGLPKAEGALVASVDPKGPAAHAGFEPGDVIVKYNGKQVDSANDLPRMVGSTRPGSTVHVEVWRKGKTRMLQAKIGTLKPENVASAAGGSTAGADRLGLTVDKLTADQKSDLDVQHGVVVKSVSGAAAQAGIQQGDVIIAVNNQDINSVRQFDQLITDAKSGHPLALLVARDGTRLYIPIRVG
ncbi:MAG TPA: DegQ family serine endoprotease [Burkholderiales bacterium]|jgi:serine protease Do|nr:DegQ family serine endoprotease [Burkholderiales bacterium]